MNKNDFLQAIAARPYDRALRLMFADWLEERGDVLAQLWRGDVVRTLEFEAASGVVNDFFDPRQHDRYATLDGDGQSCGIGYGYEGDGSGDGTRYGGYFLYIIPGFGEPGLPPGDGWDWNYGKWTHRSGRPWGFTWQSEEEE